MKTEYFIELLVTGALAVFTIAVLFLGIVGIEWVCWIDDIKMFNSEGVWASIIILFPFVYIAGIIIDRLVDNIYDKLWTNRLIDVELGGRYQYTKKVTRIFLISNNLTEAYHYTRKRIRICRSTSFLSLILLVGVLLFILNSNLYSNPSLIFNIDSAEFDITKWHKIYIVGSIFTIVCLVITIIISFSAWKTLKCKECERLNMRIDILDEIEPIGQTQILTKQKNKN